MSETILVPLKQIKANPFNARTSESAEKVAEITASIKANGMLETPSARKVGSALGGEEYQLVFGHTRLHAYQQLATEDPKKWGEMPVVVVGALTDRQMFELGVSENVKRQDLNTIEVARALQTYMDKFKATSKEAGALFGLEGSTVRGKVRLLELQPEIQQQLASGEMPESTGRQLVALKRLDKEQNAQAVESILEGEVPGEVIKQALLETNAVHMHGSWDEGEPLGGDDLWPLDVKMSEFPVDRLPKLTPAQKKLADSPKTKEQFDVLSNPPSCTTCPFYTRVHGDHYCGLPDCHARKTVAWRLRLLDETAKKLKIKVLDPKVDKDPLGLQYYDGGHKSLFAKRDADLRLMLGRSMYGGFDLPDGIKVVVVGEQAEKTREARRKEKTRQGAQGMRGNAQSAEAEAERKRQQDLREARAKAIEDFYVKEAHPLFKKALHGIGLLPEPMIQSMLDEIGSWDWAGPEKKPGTKAPHQQKATGLQAFVAYNMVYANGLGSENFEASDRPLTKAANWLNNVAKEWGVKLPASLVTKAKTADDAAVATETEPKKAKKATTKKDKPAKASTPKTGKPSKRAKQKKAKAKVKK
jgi:ParB/RepB/Spo0J family partition protein